MAVEAGHSDTDDTTVLNDPGTIDETTTFSALSLPSACPQPAARLRMRRKVVPTLARQPSARRFNAVKLIPRDWLARATVVFDDVLICFSTNNCSRTFSCSET